MPELSFESDSFIITIVDKHILQVDIKDFMELEKEDIINMQAWVVKNSKEPKLVNLIQFGNGSTASRSAREYASSPEGNNITIGSALVVKNLAQQLIIDYYIKFNSPIFPTRAFYKKDKAIAWINDLVLNS